MNSEYSHNDISAKFHACLQKAAALYEKQKEIYCPYFESKITLNSEGFNHLQNKPNRNPRTINEQFLKLSLLKKALEIIPKAGTLQEYRIRSEKTGKAGKDGFYKMKPVQYWGFHAILSDLKTNIKVVLKKTGEGNIIFWSVMLNGKSKLYSDGIEDS